EEGLGQEPPQGQPGSEDALLGVAERDLALLAGLLEVLVGQQARQGQLGVVEQRGKRPVKGLAARPGRSSRQRRPPSSPQKAVRNDEEGQRKKGYDEEGQRTRGKKGRKKATRGRAGRQQRRQPQHYPFVRTFLSISSHL